VVSADTTTYYHKKGHHTKSSLEHPHAKKVIKAHTCSFTTQNFSNPVTHNLAFTNISYIHIMAKEQAATERASPASSSWGGNDVLYGTRTLSCDLLAEYAHDDELSIEVEDDNDHDHDGSSHVNSPEAAARYQQEQQLKKVQAFVKKETFRVNVSKFIVVLAIIVAGSVFSFMTYSVVHDADERDYLDAVRIYYTWTFVRPFVGLWWCVPLVFSPINYK
jgi:hypothetical protein